MNRHMMTWLVALIAGVLAVGTALAQDEAIDWDRARALLQKQNRNEELTPQERAYLERARELRRRMMRTQEKPTAPPPPLTPLSELGEGGYKGESGGLYGDGSNVPPPALREAAARAAARVRPLDAQGRRSPAGKIVLISIGMSNTSQEFSAFQQMADADEAISPAVVIVNGAQGGRDAAAWTRLPEREDPERPSPWTVLDRRLAEAGVTAAQVQVAWLKQALAGPARLGEFPAHARRLQQDIATIVDIAKKRFPNLQLVYLSSRTYAGYATTSLNPEPYAYESAFSVRWVIQERLPHEGKPDAESGQGRVATPVVLWGPYLWTSGQTPRQSDGLVWTRQDTAADGTHPSNSGRRKVAALLLKFFKSDFSAVPWFAPPRQTD